jgi:mRNA interferase MazF
MIRQGEIWTVNLNPTVANEQAGTRPCLIISADRFNALPIRHCIVVPLTSRDRRLPHHVTVGDDGGLKRPSWAMCEALRAVSVSRLGARVGVADQPTVDAVIAQVTAWVDANLTLLT